MCEFVNVRRGSDRSIFDVRPHTGKVVSGRRPAIKLEVDYPAVRQEKYRKRLRKATHRETNNKTLVMHRIYATDIACGITKADQKEMGSKNVELR